MMSERWERGKGLAGTQIGLHEEGVPVWCRRLERSILRLCGRVSGSRHTRAFALPLPAAFGTGQRGAPDGHRSRR